MRAGRGSPPNVGTEMLLYPFANILSPKLHLHQALYDEFSYLSKEGRLQNPLQPGLVLMFPKASAEGFARAVRLLKQPSTTTIMTTNTVNTTKSMTTAKTVKPATPRLLDFSKRGMFRGVSFFTVRGTGVSR